MNTKFKYKISEGFDHFNQIDLFQVNGINNDYIGEWHTDKAEAITELNNI